MALLKGAGLYLGMWALFAASYALWAYGFHSNIGVDMFNKMEVAFGINIPPQGVSEWSAALVAFGFISLIAIAMSVPFLERQK